MLWVRNSPFCCNPVASSLRFFSIPLAFIDRFGGGSCCGLASTFRDLSNFISPLCPALVRSLKAFLVLTFPSPDVLAFPGYTTNPPVAPHVSEDTRNSVFRDVLLPDHCGLPFFFPFLFKFRRKLYLDIWMI